MSVAKRAAVVGLLSALLLGCGSTTRPLAGTIRPTGAPARGRGKIDDPRTNNPNHVKCLRQHHLPVTLFGQTGIQIGSLPEGPTIEFQSTPGAAQADVFQGERQYQGAEVIGAALLYPRGAPDRELKTIEDCLAQGVSG